jgi:MFS family permease
MRDEEGISQRTIRNILIRDYVLSFLAFFGFLVTYFALVPTLPIYLAKLGSNEREIGVLVGTIGVSSLVSRLLVGRVLLKYSERLVMMGGAILFALSFLALIVFRPFWPFFIVRLLQGIAFASLDTSAIAYAIRIVPEAYRVRAINYFFLAPSLASAIAASSGVFVVNKYSFTVLLLACTGFSLCTFLLSWKLKEETVRPAMISPARKTFLFDQKILAPAVVSFLLYFSWGGIMAFFPLYSLQCGVTNPGFFFSANAVMVILVRVLGGRIFDIHSKEKIIPILIIVTMVAVIVLSFSRTLPMFVLVGLLCGAAGGFIYPVSIAYALEYAGSSDGTAVGTYQAFMDLGLALGPATMGLIVPLTGYRVMFLCLAFTCLINLCYFQFYLRKKGGAV